MRPEHNRRIRAIVADVRCGAFQFRVGTTGDATYLQVRGFEPDAVTGAPAPPQGHGGRKWLLSEHMTRSEVVMTALKAVLAYVEHEAREIFTYRGRAIAGPHIDVEALWAAAEKLDGRAQPGSMLGVY